MHTHHYLKNRMAAERIADRHREAARRHLASRARAQQPYAPTLRVLNRTRRITAG
jgi:hypothetical protein